MIKSKWIENDKFYSSMCIANIFFLRGITFTFAIKAFTILGSILESFCTLTDAIVLLVSPTEPLSFHCHNREKITTQNYSQEQLI